MARYAFYQNHDETKIANREMDKAVKEASILIRNVVKKYKKIGSQDTSSRDSVVKKLITKIYH